MKLTHHFWEHELVVTKHTDLQGVPTADDKLNATVLAASVLEPWRNRIQSPLEVTSWWRSVPLNRFVKGHKNSLHLTAMAVDVIPTKVDRRHAFATLAEMALAGLPITEAIIYEGTRHIHVGYDWTRRLKRPSLLVKPNMGKRIDWLRYTGPLKPSRSAGPR